MSMPFNDARWDTFGLIKEAFLALDEQIGQVIDANAEVERSVIDLLIRVARSPDATARPTDLASGLSMVPSHITRCLDEAEAHKLINRKANPEDRRSTLVVLAPAGKRLLQKLEGPLTAITTELIHGLLDPVEIAALEKTLRTLRDHAQNHSPPD